ncbi:tRNA (cytidine(34)-2'-O)-methyltransferase [Oleidesulfovibrio alaskensis]|uniref:tRNA (cytidine(34)-2'-O)-methyltransferase n=1 Tax=Oleidesulfovibrio alaskensis TaxID=58180 RepID=UPI000405D6CE|nr:tRNA (cytidine(34)-2'-O)-methyltransferase [Oleidesulfovibrio alaskensis]
MHIVLFQPEIPPNTGNVARLCAATRTSLHLIEPLGFSVDDKHVRRAGLDYWPQVDLTVWPGWYAFMREVGSRVRLVMTSARGGTAVQDFRFNKNDALVFGPESRGLPAHMLDGSGHVVRIPIWGEVRSLNMSTAAGIVLYQALAASGELAGR